MTKILVLQGANMNWLGRREPEKYGTTTAAEVDAMLRERAADLSVDIEIAYCNGEGDAIDTLYRAEEAGVACAVINPGGFSYAGYALRDCIQGIKLPVIELHLTNHYARDIKSVTASAARGVFMGLGVDTYLAAFDAAARVARRR